MEQIKIPHDTLEIYMTPPQPTFYPTVYQIIDYNNSWKQCHCGRRTLMRDRFCPACGQKLGTPLFEEENTNVQSN